MPHTASIYINLLVICLNVASIKLPLPPGSRTIKGSRPVQRSGALECYLPLQENTDRRWVVGEAMVCQCGPVVCVFCLFCFVFVFNTLLSPMGKMSAIAQPSSIDCYQRRQHLVNLQIGVNINATHMKLLCHQAKLSYEACRPFSTQRILFSHQSKTTCGLKARKIDPCFQSSFDFTFGGASLLRLKQNCQLKGSCAN